MKNFNLSLGSNLENNLCTFSIFINNANSVSLLLYKKFDDDIPDKIYNLDCIKNRLGNIWSINLESIQEGTLYNWEIDKKIILDPYSLSYTANSQINNKKSIVVKKNKNKTRQLFIPKEDIIIYETHIGLFTKNKNSNVKNGGTYSAIIEKIPYLKELGINCIEFLPVLEFDDYVKNLSPNGKTLKNVWGYNPINFFALTKKYSSNINYEVFSEIEEFKNLITVLHENEIEVILDIVYNHTAEGGKEGWEYNFKSLGENIFYSKDNNNNFLNFSGCGNTLNTNHKVVKDMIIDSLLYFYLELGVDGFRFDLASILGRDNKGKWLEYSLLNELVEHPILSHAKLISESWDIGGYFVGKFPYGWSEWNGIFRDTVRRFINGEFGQVENLIKRVTGSVDVFKKDDNVVSSINFITCHDGFTLWDLVSYNEKHNLENGENNSDGENHNISFNYGIEGETRDLKIINIRKQQIKNMLLILFISQGIPMLLMGDEIARTQFGNNNAYCQDNIKTWFDWDRKNEFKDIFEFVKNLIKFRKKYDFFRKKNSWKINEDIILHGVKLYQPDLNYYSLSIAFQLKNLSNDIDFYIALNSYTEDLDFELPKLKDKSWKLLTDTSKIETSNFVARDIKDSHYRLSSKSSIILISRHISLY